MKNKKKILVRVLLGSLFLMFLASSMYATVNSKDHAKINASLESFVATQGTDGRIYVLGYIHDKGYSLYAVPKNLLSVGVIPSFKSPGKTLESMSICCDPNDNIHMAIAMSLSHVGFNFSKICYGYVKCDTLKNRDSTDWHWFPLLCADNDYGYLGLKIKTATTTTKDKKVVYSPVIIDSGKGGPVFSEFWKQNPDSLDWEKKDLTSALRNEFIHFYSAYLSQYALGDTLLFAPSFAFESGSDIPIINGKAYFSLQNKIYPKDRHNIYDFASKLRKSLFSNEELQLNYGTVHSDMLPETLWSKLRKTITDIFIGKDKIIYRCYFDFSRNEIIADYCDSKNVEETSSHKISLNSSHQITECAFGFDSHEESAYPYALYWVKENTGKYNLYLSKMDKEKITTLPQASLVTVNDSSYITKMDSRKNASYQTSSLALFINNNTATILYLDKEGIHIIKKDLSKTSYHKL